MPEQAPLLTATIAAETEDGAPGMRCELSPRQQAARAGFRRFVDEHIAPFADRWDVEGAVPDSVVERLRKQGFLGSPLPAAPGRAHLDPITYGLLTAELGRGCSSVRSLLTVHDMVSLTVARWGKPELKERYLGRMATGHCLGALALSEPEVGSDAAGVETTARRDGDSYLLDGHKKWITFGQIADVFLVLAQLEGQLTAFLVPAGSSGLVRQDNDVVMGTRASRLAELHLSSCRVPADHLLGRPGFGLSHVVSHALDHGRYSVAWGAVGVAEACLEACLDYTSTRQQGGSLLRDHQLVRRMLTNMIAGSRAARLLCYRAGHLRRSRDPGAPAETMIAKYFASQVATRSANDAVQLHGANGMTARFPVGRLLRDSRVLEIIEGSSQIQQITIPEFPLDAL